MNMVLKIVAFLSIVSFCRGQEGKDNPCKNQKDGYIVEIGCWGYISCVNGNTSRKNCTINTVLNLDNKECVDPAKVNTPCSANISCANKADGRYADNGCRSYYICYSGESFGHIFCPGKLVFDSTLGMCNWSFNAPPPCGTKKD